MANHAINCLETNARGKLSRFHELKKEWGFARFLSRSDFEDTTQGYLFNAKSVFGVEILVNKYAKGERTVLPQKLSDTTYTWRVSNYSTLCSKISSDVFIIGDCKWKLKLYLEGYGDREGKSVSLYLEFHDREAAARIYAEYMICLKSEKNGKDCKRTANHMLSASSTNWAWPFFMSLNDIEDASKGFLVEDTLIIQVEITRIAFVESFS
nr:MATH domain and coiled-coil domain-containing protein At3g58210-like [Coffea arabica]